MKALGKVLNVIGQILAVLLVIALLLNYLNGLYSFMPEIGGKILGWVSQFGEVLLVCVIALSAALRTNLIFVILVGLFIAALIGFTFYYGVITGFLPQAEEGVSAVVKLIA